MDYLKLYNIYIYERYKDLKKSEKIEYDNNDLSKIFEWFSCIYLTDLYKTQFYHYDDIHPSFKEQHQLSKNDTGIDCCDLDKSIVQCKLRKISLSWRECSTFFASQNVYNEDLNTTIVKWKNLIITRNSDCTLSDNLNFHSKRFIDTPISKESILDYCNNLILNPPSYPISQTSNFSLRPYQSEAIEFIHSSKNSCICIPTGTGKNVIIIHSFQKDKHYLILVPRIILMEQLKEEILIHRPDIKQSIQLIGDGKTSFNTKHKITICVYNSIDHVIPHITSFHKIYIDEAHHIKTPLIYEDIDYNDNNDENDSDNKDNESDDEDVEEENKKYISIISDLSKYNNNVYLSATIDEQQGFKYYKKEIRDMIEQGYLCDYTINIPIFEDDPTNKNICEYLIKNYKNIIIYCDSQKEGKKVNKLLNSIQKGCSEYIDCKTSKKKRNDIIKSYKNGDIPFLVNVRILVEGFDAPITKGVCFFHLPSNKTTIIQIIGRALRLHPLKTLASIILPFSNKDDEESIVNFIRELSQNDPRIRQAYTEKKTTGYLNITKVENDSDEDNKYDDDKEDEKENTIDLRYELIYNSLGVFVNRFEIWEENMRKVKEYINQHKKRPSSTHTDKNIKSLGVWLGTQTQNYKGDKNSMKEETIRKKWKEFIDDQKYKEYFLKNEEIWMNNLEMVKEYINKHKKRPSEKSKNTTIKYLGKWMSNQTKNYKGNKHNMKKETIRKKWKDFIDNDEYKEYFSSNEDLWRDNLNQVKKYIDQYKKRPSQLDNDKDIKSLGWWLTDQFKNYKGNRDGMKDENIKQKWEEFINDKKYKEYFLSNEEIWKDNLEKAKEYIDKHKKRPHEKDKDQTIKSLGRWISCQTQNYKCNKKCMKEETIRKKWKDFIDDDKYKQYFTPLDI
jgi:superfamily II DNA or RNA helicase